MTEQSSAGPSKNALLKGGLLALVIAIVVTLLFVLPAEYGVDPTGIGSKLGLLELATVEEPVNEDPYVATRVVTGSYPGVADDFDFWEPEVLGEPFSKRQSATFKSDTLTIKLDVGEQVEYKAIMQQGDVLVYSWKADSDTVYFDFHADPGEAAEGYPDQYYIRYQEGEENEAAGSIVAPFDGNHGWYWLNIENDPIEISLQVRGFYDHIEELGRSYQ